MAKTKSRSRLRKPHIDQAKIVGEFAGRLRALRQSRGLKQQELAARAQVNGTYLGRLERAESAPGIDLVERLALALGASVADLLPLATTDPVPLLRDQAETRFQSILKRADRGVLNLLVPLLAVLDDQTRLRSNRPSGR